jgi:hypothetical protein
VRIPPFFWAVMLILGFNEIMALLGNPLLLFLFVVLGLMAYAAWLAGLLDVPLQIATGTNPSHPSLISGGFVLLTSSTSLRALVRAHGACEERRCAECHGPPHGQLGRPRGQQGQEGLSREAFPPPLVCVAAAAAAAACTLSNRVEGLRRHHKPVAPRRRSFFNLSLAQHATVWRNQSMLGWRKEHCRLWCLG